MPSRRLHQKTRHGCNQCKARKVKASQTLSNSEGAFNLICPKQCDENRLGCSRCIRSGAQCSLVELQPSGLTLVKPRPTGSELTPTGEPHLGSLEVPSSHFRRPSSQGDAVEAPLSLQIPIRSQLSLLDLELMHHYSTITCFEISRIPAKQSTWQISVPREALTYPFLMHALLAVSAAHLMHIRPSRQHIYEEAATKHQNLALTSSIPFLNNITPINCHALFALSNIVSVLSLVFPHPSAPPLSGLPSDPLDTILEFFTVIRGVKTVLSSAEEWIAQGPLATFTQHNWEPSLAPLADDVKAAFECLERRVEEAADEPVLCEAYARAIQRLKVAFQTDELIRDEPGLAFIWPVVVPEGYMMGLRNRTPMALAILGHYAVLLHSSNGPWWLEGRGRLLLEAVCQVLPSEWLSAVDWPQETIEKSFDFAFLPTPFGSLP